VRSNISRRGLLRGAAALSAAPAVGIAPTSAPVDPIFAVIAEAGAVIIQRPSGPDPIYEVIATHRQARAASNASPYGCMKPGDVGEAEAEAADKVLEDREIGALKDVLTTRPTTIAGLLDLLDYIAGHPDYLLREGGEESETFPALLATTARSLIGSRHATPAPAEPDPIIAAIKAEQQAVSEFNALTEPDANPANDDGWDRLESAWIQARARVFATEPTTVAGAIAALRRSEGQIDDYWGVNEKRFLRMTIDVLAKKIEGARS
jgi:hypothetical protein